MDLRKLNPVKDLKMAMALNVKKLTGNFFVLAALGMICLVYYTFVIKLYLPMGLESITVRVILGCFHITFPMLVWSFFQTMVTDPGKVPPYWGFYINDSE
jgi:palmitoyltransferase